MSQPPPTGPTSGGWGTPGPSPYDGGAGGAVTGTPSTAGRGGGRRGALLIGGAVAAVAVVGGGVWGATAFFSTGAQPAEALPADTLAYVGVDLDPSGGQKLEALRTLEKFPILGETTDLDADTDTDLKRTFFDLVQDAGGCEGLDYDDDLGDWLGDRVGVGVVPGEDEPDVVVVAQVSDAGAAEDGLAALADCAVAEGSQGAEEAEGFGSVVDGDWAVVAETEDIAQGVVDDAAEGTLAADADFDRWVDAAGDPGVLTAYAAPALADEFRDGGFGGDPEPGVEAPLPPVEVLPFLEDFEGAALTVRFADEGLEVQTAISGDATVPALQQGTDVAEVVDGLPADTAALLAADLEPGWAGDTLDGFAELSGVDRGQLVEGLESGLGIAVPDDLERLLGQGVALAVSPDVDLEGLADGSTPPEEAAVGGRVLTDDAEASEGVLDQLRGTLPDDELVVSETGDGRLVVSPDDAYRELLLEDGDLSGDDGFTDAVPMLDRSASVLYVDLDRLDDYSGLVDDLTGDPRVSDNLEPLAAVGISGWAEDGVTTGLLRLTTD